MISEMLCANSVSDEEYNECRQCESNNSSIIQADDANCNQACFNQKSNHPMSIISGQGNKTVTTLEVP